MSGLSSIWRSAFRRWSRGGDRGFTLLELLVSLALLAALLVILPSTIRLAARASTVSAELMAGTNNNEALNFIRHALAEAMPLPESDEQGAIGITFRGDARGLTFVSPLAHGPAGGGLYRIRLDVVERVESSAFALQLTLLPFGRAGDSELAPLESRRFAGNFSSADLRYYGLQEGRESPDWSSTWTRNDRLPDLIELNLVPASNAMGGPVTVKIEPRLRRRS